MMTYDQTRIKQSEVAQLIILQSLFSLRESKGVIFQGGTAIRWFYGGLRFPEELHFPIQNRLKIVSRSSSLDCSPVISLRASRPEMRSSAMISRGEPDVML